jgi:co-chaperonin GroES (HSP10)
LEEPVIDLAEGDVVAYRKYGEYKFLIASKRYLFIRMEDVLGVIRKTDGGAIE